MKFIKLSSNHHKLKPNQQLFKLVVPKLFEEPALAKMHGGTGNDGLGEDQRLA